jgi:hypothetical protein
MGAFATGTTLMTMAFVMYAEITSVTGAVVRLLPKL